MVIARRGTIYREMLVGEMLERKKKRQLHDKILLKSTKKNNCLGKTSGEDKKMIF